MCVRVAKVAMALRAAPAARDLFNSVAEHRSNGGIRLENMATLVWTTASERNKCIMLQALHRRFGGAAARDADDDEEYEAQMAPAVSRTLKAPLDRLFFEMVQSLADLIQSTDPTYYKSGEFAGHLYQYTDMWNPTPEFAKTPMYEAQLKNLPTAL